MSLTRNTLWNIAGLGLPLLAAAAFIPYTLGKLGTEAFGVLVLIWALIGYFGLFDMGLGRALTFEISKLRADHRESIIAPTLKAGLLMSGAAGLLGAVVMGIIAPQLATNWLKIATPWQSDAQLAFQIAALGVIPTTVTSGMRGALEGFERFAASNLNRIFMGLCMFALPALSIWLHGNQVWCITLYLVGARLLVVIASALQLRKHLIEPSSKKITKYIKPLLSYGSWVTISGIVGPMMIYGDRFFVSAAVGADQLPFYAIPQEGLQRLLIIPGALCSALLPRFVSIKGNDLANAFKVNYRRIAVVMLLACAAAALLAHPILSWWLSPSFAERVMPVVLVLSVGIWFNSIAQLPYTLLHAHGHPKLTAMFHLFELVFYFITLYWLATYYGLLGAAIAWLARVVLDLVLLQIAANQLLKKVDKSGRA